MSEIMQKKINKKWKVVAGVASFIIAFFGFVAISGFIFEFNHMLYKERAYHFNETASQITATVDIAIDEQWSLLQIMSVRFSAFDEYTTEECISKITVMENELGKDGLLFGIIDKDGNIFATNEDKKVYTLDGLKLDENQEKTLAILSPVEDSDTEYMTFIMKNEMPVTLGDGRVITHTVVFWEMDYYKKIFHNDAYGEENSIFIRGNDGVNIYTESQKYNFLKGFNYMDVYPEVELVKGNTIKEIEENIKNNKSSVTSIKVLSENKKYFITVQQMRNNDWDLVMVVPQEFISAETIDIASAMVNTATFIAILICFGILMLVVYILYCFYLRCYYILLIGNLNHILNLYYIYIYQMIFEIYYIMLIRHL
jgi:hypothetical protein